MKDKDTLEWAAQWIEDSLKGETNERVIGFGRNMAMTFRAAGISISKLPLPRDYVCIAPDAPLDRLHLELCLRCKEGVAAYDSLRLQNAKLTQALERIRGIWHCRKDTNPKHHAATCAGCICDTALAANKEME